MPAVVPTLTAAKQEATDFRDLLPVSEIICGWLLTAGVVKCDRLRHLSVNQTYSEISNHNSIVLVFSLFIVWSQSQDMS